VSRETLTQEKTPEHKTIMYTHRVWEFLAGPDVIVFVISKYTIQNRKNSIVMSIKTKKLDCDEQKKGIALWN